MVLSENLIGKIVISDEFFAQLVGNVVSNCFGVKGMVSRSPLQDLKSFFIKSSIPEKGVTVIYRDESVIIDIHIEITYGLNISEIVKSIVHKVRYAVEEATGLEVKKVNVYVAKMSV